MSRLLRDPGHLLPDLNTIVESYIDPCDHLSPEQQINHCIFGNPYKNPFGKGLVDCRRDARGARGGDNYCQLHMQELLAQLVSDPPTRLKLFAPEFDRKSNKKVIKTHEFETPELEPLQFRVSDIKGNNYIYDYTTGRDNKSDVQLNPDSINKVYLDYAPIKIPTDNKSRGIFWLSDQNSVTWRDPIRKNSTIVNANRFNLTLEIRNFRNRLSYDYTQDPATIMKDLQRKRRERINK